MLSHFSRVQLFDTPWTVNLQAPLSTGFFRQENWSRWLCPSPGDLPNPSNESTSLLSLALAGGFFLFSIYFISWRLITLQYCSGFCHTLTWISHGFTCVPHPNPLSCLPPHPIPLGLPSAPALSTCLMPPTWVICFTLDSILVSMLFSQSIPPLPSPTESKSLFCTPVSLSLFCI